MAVATIEADEAVASSVFVQIMGTPLKHCWSGSFWSFLVTLPRLILRSGYGDVNAYQQQKFGEFRVVIILHRPYTDGGLWNKVKLSCMSSSFVHAFNGTMKTSLLLLVF